MESIVFMVQISWLYKKEWKYVKQLPKKKFRHIEWSERDDLFEFKKNQMRVYVVKQGDVIYIVMGGWKNNQKLDISKFKKRIKTFKN